MAKMLPTAAIQRGMLTGRLKARMMPVTTALRSPIVTERFIIFLAASSESTQVMTVVAVTASTRGPNMTVAAINAGIRAIITSSIMPRVVFDERRCGEALTVSFFPLTIIYCPPL